MSKDLSGGILGVVHTTATVTPIGKKFSDEIMPEVRVLHIGDDTLQREFLDAGVGRIPSGIPYRIAVYARFLQQAGAQVVMVGCSTVSPAVDAARPMVDVPLLQIDRPMMDRAVSIGRRIALVATLDTTVPSSTRLLQRAADQAGKQIEIVQSYLPGAYFKLRDGDRDGHDQAVLEAIDRVSREVDVVVMAQLSMSVLEDKVKGFGVPVLCSGREGYSRAREMLAAL